MMRTFALLVFAMASVLVVTTAAAVPLTNAELRTQVAAYKSDRTAAEAEYGPIATWDTSAVTNMRGLFAYEWDAVDRSFNGDISGWDTSNVVTMAAMFKNCKNFNQDIGAWDTSKVTDMRSAFYHAQVFNKDVGGWDTSSVRNMNFMFSRAKHFNQDLGGWCTAQVTDMSHMFRDARSFDGSLPWDTSSVPDTDDMFKGSKEGSLTDTDCRNCHSEDCRPDLSCTAAQAKLGWTKHASLGICAGSKGKGGVCLGKSAKFTSALEQCDAIGARLCTKDELYENKAGIGTGCGGDKHLVWTSQKCRNGKRRLAINVKSRETTCSKLSSRRQVRCCADATDGPNPRSVTTSRQLRGRVGA